MADLTSRIGSGILSGGAWMLVIITPSEQSAVSPGQGLAINVCSGFSFDEDFHVNPAEVIGFLGPIAYDSQGYTCTINMDMFIKRPSEEGNPAVSNDINAMFPIRSDILANGRLWDNSLTVVDIADSSIMNHFMNVILATNGVQMRPNAYVTRNARFYAVERSI